MKLLRHLLSHFILIIILFGLVSLYYYRYQIIPDSYTKTMDAYTDKIHPSIKVFARNIKQKTETQVAVIKVQKQNITDIESTNADTQIAEPKQVIVETPAVDDKVASSVISSDKTQSTSVDIPVADVDYHQDEEVVNEETKAKNRDANKIDKASSIDTLTHVPAASETQNVIEAKVVESVEMDKSSPNTTDKELDSTEDLLRAARMAFNNGNIDLSIKKYQDLIELDNDEADFHGELGNVYYTKGDWSNAGVEYYEAAIRLIEKKQFAQISYLQRVIQGLDAERAEKLANEMANK